MTRCAPLVSILVFCLTLVPLRSIAQGHALPPPVGGITFEQVIRLSQSGLSDDVIVAQIKKRSQPFDLSADQLIQLKSEHVSDVVIQAMMIQPSADGTQPLPGKSTSAEFSPITVPATTGEHVVAGDSINTQLAASWQHTRDDDPLHNKVYDRLILDGKYLTPPRSVARGFVPSIVVECADGKVEQNYITIGAVATLRGRGQPIFADLLDSRIDGKRGAIAAIGIATDGTGVFFTRVDLKSILRAHEVIVGVYEYLGVQIVLQFIMPDPTPVYTACGRDRLLKKR